MSGFNQIIRHQNAELLGDARVCYLTGQPVEFFQYRNLNLETPNGRIFRRVYLNSYYSSLGRKAINEVESKIVKGMYEGLEYTTKEINLNFRIKVSGTRDGVKYNKLVGVSGLIKLVGIELANNLISRAFNSSDDNIYCKLRTGLKITFYSK